MSLDILSGFGKKAEPAAPVAETVPQAPINYDRIQAILNSGILKNPNASMDAPPYQAPAPAPAPAPVQQQGNSIFDLIFQRLSQTPAFKTVERFGSLGGGGWGSGSTGSP